MDIRKIKRLIELLDESGVAEIDLKRGEGSVRISRASMRKTAQPLHYVARVPLAAQVGFPKAAARLPADSTMAGKLNPNGHVITAPIVGTFYGSPARGTKPFVEVGDAIRFGQTLCFIEAMKMLHEIKADRSGRVALLMARSGDPVEFAQPLFVIE
jgi:acetyl-CoA carboxylase biotin carboxyl carrier protein